MYYSGNSLHFCRADGSQVAFRRDAGERSVGAVVASHMKTTFTSQTWSLVSTGSGTQCRAFLISDGNARLMLADETEVELAAPSIAWIPRALGLEFKLEAGGGGIELSAPEEFVWRTIGDSAVAVDLKSLMGEIALASAGNMPVDEVRTSFEAIAREARTPDAGSSSIVGFNLGLVLLHLWRAVGTRPSQSKFLGGGAALVQRYRQLVEVHFRDGLRVADYARTLGVSRERLADACGRAEDTTPQAIVHARILEEAQRRLSKTEMSVEQVAYSLGFRDAPYFNRFFTRMTGTNPGAFRKAAMKANRPVESTSFAAWP